MTKISSKQEFFPRNEEGLFINTTNASYQATFMPIFYRAELEIKKKITKAIMTLMPEDLLRRTLNEYIKLIDSRIPQDLENRNEYINGLKEKTNKMIKEYYSRAKTDFLIIAALILANTKKVAKPIKVNTPLELITKLKEDKKAFKLDMWSQQKAAVRVENYYKKVDEAINKMSKEPITTKSEDGKKNISLWQKAELDVRHKEQMAKVEKLKEDGVTLAWLSSHPDCSKRCQKWQGKLVSLKEHAKMSGMRVGKVDGEWVYSLTDIMAQKDKYGYENNIISGFNCRHYLIPYEKGKKPPKEYSEQEVKKMRAVSQKIREFEREIRNAYIQAENRKAMNDTKGYKHFLNRAKNLERQYKEYCERNGFAWESERIRPK